MKKSTIPYLIIGLSVLSACTDDEGLNIPLNTVEPVGVNPIIAVAQQAYYECYPSSSRNGFATFYDQDIVHITTLKSRAASPDTVMYIVNEAEGNGFVALTGGSRPEILAVSDNGTITDINDIDNPGLQMFFDAASSYSSKIGEIGGIEMPEFPVPSFKEVVETIADTICEPRCKVQWGQEYPEGIFCPNKISGCGVTASAQLLSYFELPKSIKLSYDAADQDSINLNWAFIKRWVSSKSWYEYYNSNENSIQLQLSAEENLGRLCRQLGNLMGATYKSGATSTILDYNAYVIEQLCPTLNVSGKIFGIPKARKSLGNGIILMRGESYSNEADSISNNHSHCSGHAWILDGFIYKFKRHHIYVRDSEGNYNYSPEESYVEDLDLQHINWGWNGTCNGYFKIDVFNPSEGVVWDDEAYQVRYNFSHTIRYYVVTK